FGHYSHKPYWRPDAHGKGEPVSQKEASRFVHYALDLALGWRRHTREMIADLVGSVARLPPGKQREVWLLVEAWSQTASEADRAELRETIRATVLTRGARRGVGQRQLVITAARRAYDGLAPTDSSSRIG
ncbi:MAG: addiction module antitoxin, partial [Alphaproteobacteria bacterium]|nr:addiction module antitoxin [Alphaproteobacteria bacterium]